MRQIHPGPALIKPAQLDPLIKDQLGKDLLWVPVWVKKFLDMLEGLHDTKFHNYTDKIVDNQCWNIVNWTHLEQTSVKF